MKVSLSTDGDTKICDNHSRRLDNRTKQGKNVDTGSEI